MASFRTRKSCVLCGCVQLTEALKLPSTPLANEFVAQPTEQERFPLTLNLCDACGHLQLAEVVDPKRLFSRYVYVSGTSPAFVRHFAEYARDVKERLALGSKSVVVDVGSNDGTLLKQFRELGIEGLLGVEPAINIAAEAFARDGIPFEGAFLSRRTAGRVRERLGAADVVTANNVFAHADDLGEIAAAAQALLHPDGEFIFEVSYLRDVVEKQLFDTIYHEHLSYHAVKPLVPFLARHGLTLYDAERVPTHGGSIRCYASRATRPRTQALDMLISEESRLGLFDLACYKKLGSTVVARGAELRATLRQLAASGKRIVGYGAPAKLTTLMYAYGLEQSDILAIVDDAPLKQGLYTPGTNIPVRSPEWLRKSRPDVIVIFAWNFFDQIATKLREVGTGILINPSDGRMLQCEAAA
jgi:hypothetical protein